MNQNIFCVIMAGGFNSRFWPISKTTVPKQFVDILGNGRTLFQDTFNRFEKICPKEHILVVTHSHYKEIVKKQIPGLNEDQILCEPSRRNTAPCIAYAYKKVQSINPQANIIITPSDHFISDEDLFCETIEKALSETEKSDKLVTLGIKTTSPNTEYGYIQYDDSYVKEGNEQLKRVITFTEKPEYEMAVQFIESGDFLWNTGVFIGNLNTIKAAYAEHLPEVYSLFETIKEISKGEVARIYAECPSISIDYGIFEKATNVYVMVSDFGWSDISTWATLYDVQKKDTHKNVVTGKNVLTYDTNNCLIQMPKDKLVVIQGLDDYIIVEGGNSLLICKKAEEHLIKKFVSDIEIEKGERYI